MRMKGIGWFEQNVEKVIAAVFAFAMIAVLTLQFAGPKSTVKVGKNEVALEEAFDAVGKQASGVKTRIEAIDPPEAKPDIIARQLGEFPRVDLALQAQLINASG